MKIGCCVNMVAVDAAKIGIDRIETLAALGYDYVELPLAQVMDLDENGFEQLVGRVKASGIECLACNNFFPPTLRLTGPEQTGRDALVRYITVALSRAELLGASNIVFGSAGAKNIPPGFKYRAAWNQIVEVLRLIDELIKNREIHVAIEPLNRRESNMILTATEGLMLATEVARPHIRLLVDYYHMMLEGESTGVIGQASGYLRHIHIANPAGRIWPRTGDGAEYAVFIRALKAAGYSGGISIEAFSNSFESDAKAALTFMRELCG